MPGTAPNPVPELKEHLRRALVDALDGWSQVNAGVWIGSDQPRMSNLRRGNLERISLEQLIQYLARIQRRIELVVHDERTRKTFGMP